MYTTFFALLVFVAGYRLRTIVACISKEGNYGEMNSDTSVMLGTDFTLNCTLTATTVEINNTTYSLNSSMLYFKRKDEKMRIPDTIGNKTALLTVKNSDFNDSASYYCYVGLPTGDRFVCVTQITVGIAPRLVPKDHFRCVGMYFRNLTCSWDPPFTGVHTNYTLEMFPYGAWPLGVSSCAERPNNTACVWKIDSEPPYRLSSSRFIFKLTSMNIFGTIVQQFYVDHYEVVVPDKPQDFYLEAVNSTYISVKWEPPEYAEHDETARRHMKYQLQYRRFGETSPTIVDVGSVEHYTISDLVPFTNYLIKLRCRVANDSSESKWSPFATSQINMTTLIDVPFYSPQFTAFETVETSEKHRSVTVYWTPVSMKYQNAPGFKYILYCIPTTLSKRRLSKRSTKNIIELDPLETSYTFDELDTSMAFAFKISSTNDVGNSKESSLLEVDVQRRLPEKPKDVFVYYYGNASYEVRWTRSNDIDDIKWYTVFWCPFVHESGCRDQLNWTTIGPTEEVTVIDVVNEDISYQFAVAANSEYSSSGLVWANTSNSSVLIVQSTNRGLVVGIAVGCAMILVLVLFGFITLAKALKKKLDEWHKFGIQLPDGLKTIPEDSPPPKVKPFTESDEELRKVDSIDFEAFKNRHNSGTSQMTVSSTDGLLTNLNHKTRKFERTYSDQSNPDTGHESVSSASTCATQVSSDSGAVDDRNDFMYYSKSQVQENKNMKSSLPSVEGNQINDSSGSKDSGLDVSSNNSAGRILRKNKKNRLKKQSNDDMVYMNVAKSESSLYEYSKSSKSFIPNEIIDRNVLEMKHARSATNIFDHLPSETIRVNLASITEQRVDSDLDSKTLPISLYTKSGYRKSFPIRDNYVTPELMRMMPPRQSNYVQSKVNDVGDESVEGAMNRADLKTETDKGFLFESDQEQVPQDFAAVDLTDCDNVNVFRHQNGVCFETKGSTQDNESEEGRTGGVESQSENTQQVNLDSFISFVNCEPFSASSSNESLSSSSSQSSSSSSSPLTRSPARVLPMKKSDYITHQEMLNCSQKPNTVEVTNETNESPTRTIPQFVRNTSGYVTFPTHQTQKSIPTFAEVDIDTIV